MKLELRRKQELTGKVFYQVWADGTIQESFYAGIVSDPSGEEQAKNLAQVWYDRIRDAGIDKIEVLQSEEI